MMSFKLPKRVCTSMFRCSRISGVSKAKACHVSLRSRQNSLSVCINSAMLCSRLSLFFFLKIQSHEEGHDLNSCHVLHPLFLLPFVVFLFLRLELSSETLFVGSSMSVLSGLFFQFQLLVCQACWGKRRRSLLTRPTGTKTIKLEAPAALEPNPEPHVGSIQSSELL